jgi:hypothetical protein
MSAASEKLRREAARVRRMKFLIVDAPALDAIEQRARELERRAEAIEAQEKGEKEGRS